MRRALFSAATLVALLSGLAGCGGINSVPRPVYTSGRAYAANSGAGTVSVVATRTETVVATVAVGARPVGVAVLPALSRLFVSDAADGTVRVVNTTTNQVLATVALGTTHAGAMAADTRTGRLFVVESSEAEPGTRLFVVDGATHAVLATLTLGGRLQQVAVDVQAQRAYVTDAFSPDSPMNGRLHVVNTVTLAAVTSIPLGRGPAGVDVDPVFNRAYVTLMDEDRLAVVDTARNEVVGSVATRLAPRAVAVDTLEHWAYVASEDEGKVTAFDLNTVPLPTGLVTVNVGAGPVAVAVDPPGGRVYVACRDTTNVWLIDTTTHSAIKAMNVGSLPVAVAVAP